MAVPKSHESYLMLSHFPILFYVLIPFPIWFRSPPCLFWFLISNPSDSRNRFFRVLVLLGRGFNNHLKEGFTVVNYTHSEIDSK